MSKVYMAHTSLDKLSVKRNKIVNLLSNLDQNLIDFKVGALDRGKVTELMIAELIGNSAQLGSIEIPAQEHFRTAILPAAQALLEGLVEVLTIDSDRTIKAAFAVYRYRHRLAYPTTSGWARPSLEKYAEGFEKVMGDMVLKYPDITNGVYTFELALTQQ